MKYIISETQYRTLIQKKKDEKIAKQILEEIKKAKKVLNEEKMLNESIVHTLRRYFNKGLLTLGVLGVLLANNVSAQDLANAGVSENDIKIAQQTTQQVSPEKAERAIIQNLNKAGQEGTLKQFQSLDQQKKTNLINAVINQTNGDLSKLKNMDLSIYLNHSTKLGGDQFTKIGQEKTISVDTIYVDVVRDYETEFEFNSAKLKNSEETKSLFKEYLKAFESIDNITIVASSSTLRNTGELEGHTWKKSSEMRVDAMKDILIGMEYNLEGCEGKTNTITEDLIQQNIDGTNGDGTSGPKSPFEVNKKVVQSYEERGIDPEFWDSNATEPPLVTVKELDDNSNALDVYKKYQYIKVVISGQVVETKTNEVLTLDYLKMKVKEDGGTIKPYPEKKEYKELICPVRN